jgi:hypothetical protein
MNQNKEKIETDKDEEKGGGVKKQKSRKCG